MTQFHGTVGIITPYRAQLELLNAKLRDAFPESMSKFASKVEVNTVDGFQGREKDVIIRTRGWPRCETAANVC